MRRDRSRAEARLLPETLTQDLCDSGFQLIIYGERADPGVGELVSRQNAVATIDPEEDLKLHGRKVALLNQGGRREESFAQFVSRFFAHNIGHIYELRVINVPRLDGARPAAAQTQASPRRRSE
jgi:hypothetical protein